MELTSEKVIITDATSEPDEIIDLAGYQVTRAEFFAHQREVAITVWSDRVKFNMACVRKFPGVTHIQFMIHPDQKRLLIRPCDQDAPDSIRWVSGGGEKEIKNRDMVCRIFAEKLFDLMRWDRQYRYKILGKPATCGNEALFLFKLSDFELFVSTGKRRSASYLPEDWRDYFGSPALNHEDSYKINPADGYITIK